MLSEDLVGAIEHMAETIDNAFGKKNDNANKSFDSLCDSIDKLCKTVADDKNGNNNTVIGILAGVLAGDADKLKKGSEALTESVSALSDTLKVIGDDSKGIVKSSEAISEGMKNLSEGIESIGLRTVLSAYLAKIAFPAINAFVTGSVELFASIASKEKDLKAADEGLSSMGHAIKSLTSTAFFAIAAGIMAIPATIALIPMSLFILGSVGIFTLCDKLFNLKRMKPVGEAISALAKGLYWLSLAALVTTLAAPVYLTGIAGLIPASLFVMAAAGINILALKLFGGKQGKINNDAIREVGRGLLTLGLSALCAIIVAPVMLAAIPFLLVDGLFILAYDVLIVRQVAKMTKDKNFKDFKKGCSALAMGTLLLGLTALATVVFAPVFIVGAVALLAEWAFVALAGKVYKQAAKHKKDYIEGTLGLVVMSLGLLATTFLLVETSKIGQDLLSLNALGVLALVAALSYGGAQLFKRIGKIGLKTIGQGALATVLCAGSILITAFILSKAVEPAESLLSVDVLGAFAVIAGVSYGGAQLMKAVSKSLSQILQGGVAVIAVAGTVYAAAWCFNNAVKNCKEFIADPTGTLEGLGALIVAVTGMGAAIAAAGFALPFILIGAPAVLTVAGTVLAAAKAIDEASDAYDKSQKSGAFALDGDGDTPFAKTVHGVITSMINATKDIDDIDKLGKAIEAILPVSDFVESLAVGVSEFSKIALMKGEIADSEGKKHAFNLTMVGEGIGNIIKSIMNGISDALKAFDFDDESKMVEITSGGFLGIGGDKIKVPKQIAVLRHLTPLADFVEGLATGVSEFSKLATQQGELVGSDGKKHAFNLKDVGAGISSVMVSLMTGIHEGLDALWASGSVTIKSGGFLGIGADEIEVPKDLAALEKVEPLCNFVNAIAELVSALGKGENGKPISIDTDTISGVFDGIVKCLNVEDLGDVMEDNAEGVEDMGNALKAFLGAGWNNLPKKDDVTPLQDIITYFKAWDAKTRSSLANASWDLANLGKSIKSVTENKDDLEDIPDAITASVQAVNALDLDKCKELSKLYENMAKAAELEKRALENMVKAIKDSADAVVDALDHANKLGGNNSNNNNTSSSDTDKGSYLQKIQAESNRTARPNSRPATPTPSAPSSAPGKQKVEVDLSINGIDGDQWIISRRN